MDGIDSRPKKFGEVLGQEAAKRLLTETLRKGNFSRAYTFAGPLSIGKTTLATLFARSLLCKKRDPETQDPCNECSSCKNFLRDAHPDYTEVDAARHGSKENVDAILSQLNYDSLGMRVILLDEAHMISKAGKDAALKSLETPVEYDRTVFLFCTTEGHKMPGTLRSRCVPVPLTIPTPDDVIVKLERICKENGVSYDSGSLRALAEWSQGRFREAENALEPLVMMGGVNYDNVCTFTGFDVDSVSSMLVYLDSDLAKALECAESLCNRFGADTLHSSVLRVLLEALQYGLSGGSRDTYESVKNVYSVYGSRLGMILNHFSSKGKMSDPRLLQSEIVQTYYKCIKGDFEFSNQNQGFIESKENKKANSTPSKEKDRLAAQREMKMQARGKVSMDKTDDKISDLWGEEEVSESIQIKRS